MENLVLVALPRLGFLLRERIIRASDTDPAGRGCRRCPGEVGVRLGNGLGVYLGTRRRLASRGTLVKRPVWWVPATVPERERHGEPGPARQRGQAWRSTSSASPGEAPRDQVGLVVQVDVTGAGHDVEFL